MLSEAEKPTAEFLDVAIWRGNAKRGVFHSYKVPQLENQTILDVVSYVQRHIEPKLTYRFACRVGMCGSCAMMVNGRPMWTCRTHVDRAMRGIMRGNPLTIEPLRNLPVIKDLACDMSGFFEKWTRAEGRFHPTRTRSEAIEAISPDSDARKAANEAIECINCAVCYAACDAVTGNKHYLGPAALNRAWTLINDQRDGGRNLRLSAVSGKGGCHNCHSQQSCSNYCPNELNPTMSITGLKRETTKAALKREI
ncbi:MAG: succinate dehydrogenase/fumarate reductase iron-sulfur subunit [Hyphomicrobiales bacterium]|nr:succinate dehydrogenase/fumarate reductase iron-sulfur subunit [Hyphomicrobiales bacterium]